MCWNFVDICPIFTVCDSRPKNIPFACLPLLRSSPYGTRQTPRTLTHTREWRRNFRSTQHRLWSYNFMPQEVKEEEEGEKVEEFLLGSSTDRKNLTWTDADDDGVVKSV